jgi:hypothetical protein
MRDYNELVRRDRRRDILAFLDASAEYTSNGEVIRDVLNHRGIGSTLDEVRTELWWLREQGFVELEDHGHFVVVTARQRGLEIARGLGRHPDVSRPIPRR